MSFADWENEGGANELADEHRDDRQDVQGRPVYAAIMRNLGVHSLPGLVRVALAAAITQPVLAQSTTNTDATTTMAAVPAAVTAAGLIMTPQEAKSCVGKSAYSSNGKNLGDVVAFPSALTRARCGVQPRPLSQVSREHYERHHHPARVAAMAAR
jgi:hypothetical protein